LTSATQLIESPIGQSLLLPFYPFVQLIVATQWSTALAGWALTAGLLNGGMLALLMRLDRLFDQLIARRQRVNYPPGAPKAAAPAARSHRRRTRGIPWLMGAGPLFWRQWHGALRHRGSLLFALALPGILASTPIFIFRDGKQALLNVTAALVFYSFLLLPAALKFDFRRDIRRMPILKTLPIAPTPLVIGQIVAPATLAFLFQLALLLLTIVIRPCPLWMLWAVLGLLAPLDLLIFGLDNLAYLLYPYRLNQEGIEIFLRTTLTFTAKGLLFALALVMTFAWSFAARTLAERLSGPLADPALVFVAGAWLMLVGACLLTVWALSHAFRRFDPSRDLPA
jgi:hypothetical protein